jgi:nitroimidazol reductase NimA-like FMN-containing flavoprotein (pyridoxamine 5'-phosphate oxidase superfamily)
MPSLWVGIGLKESDRVSKTDIFMEKLKKLINSTQLAVLSTEHSGEPYASLVAFAVTDNLREILFATSKATRKFSYLKDNNSVALLVDNRSNSIEDFQHAMAVTVLGTASVLEEDERHRYLKLYLDKLPHLAGFVESPSCALILVKVSSYYLVDHFQKVMEFHFQS